MTGPHPAGAGLRVEDATFTCLRCWATITFPGAWDGDRIAAWTAVHTEPMLTGWAVRINGGVTTPPVTRDPPPPVLQRPWKG